MSEIDEDVEGVHDISLVAKDVGDGVIDLAWFELSDFSERSDVYARIPANEYSDQSGTQFVSNSNMGYYHDGDYITYANVNFGPVGTTDGISIRYSKGSHNDASVLVKLGGPDGQVIADFTPAFTGGWSNWVEAYVGLDNDVEGIYDLTFVGKGGDGILDLDWFELSAH